MPGFKAHDPNLLLVALKRAVVARCEHVHWMEIGALTSSTELINAHPRLLRSLHFGDDDYEDCVLEILRQIVQAKESNADVLEEYLDLPVWLNEHDAALASRLYSPSASAALARAICVGRELNIPEVQRHASRIRNAVLTDPQQALGSAKELLETVMRAILGRDGQSPAGEFHQLLKAVQKKLMLAPHAVDEKLPGAETLKRTLSNLGQIVLGVAELRNLYGTGHGRFRSRDLDIAYTRLAVDSAIVLATFLLEPQEAGTDRGAEPW